MRGSHTTVFPVRAANRAILPVLWRDPLPLQQLAKQPFGGFRITSALNQDVEHDAVLVDGAPQPVRRPGDLDDDLVKVPLVATARRSPTDAVNSETVRNSV